MLGIGKVSTGVIPRQQQPGAPNMAQPIPQQPQPPANRLVRKVN